jgi:hypothetical protein
MMKTTDELLNDAQETADAAKDDILDARRALLLSTGTGTETEARESLAAAERKYRDAAKTCSALRRLLV